MLLALLAACELVEALRPAPPVEVVAEAPPPVVEVAVEPAPEPVAAPVALPPGAAATLVHVAPASGACELATITLPSMSRKVIARFTTCPARLHMAPGAPRWIAEGMFPVEGDPTRAVRAYLLTPETGALEAIPPAPLLQDRDAEESRLVLRPDGLMLAQANYVEVPGECEGPCQQVSARGTWRLGPGGWEVSKGDAPESSAVLEQFETWPEMEWIDDPALSAQLGALASNEPLGGWFRCRPADASIPALAVAMEGSGESELMLGPVLVETGQAWALLPESSRADDRMHVVKHWVLLGDGRATRVYDLRDGAIAARLDGLLWPWPDNVPVPSSVVVPSAPPARP